ncbi:3-deoxy-8-phosphooctulonate synthase [Syntrophorhabdus aromaticivorans]|uniref:2-dehydro-3-deoxyphosphooctonate aldolase n=1 Tax=Syntrophorhabdus aromaticivorans TaxID=328301 RepID=A0A971M5Y8_9BACT|nr:3-deoxy-8-phosphooctulonate synthase [Syntrophorhabdus aromaticivorans]NLW36520.1 3-deoxy-8-phosphooctulonate synthase [Syntrophorhabdus aromaticivorans]
MQKQVKIGTISVGARPFVFIGGPCVIEGRDITLRIAERLRVITSDRAIPFIFKSSYDKANRTSISSFRGPGIEKGLKILAEVREKLDVPVLTDVHSTEEAAIAATVVDVLQVPALLSRQTDLLVACGKTGKPVNIKKGQFLAPHDMKHAIEKVESTGNSRIMVTERGTYFGYNNLVNDFRALSIMKEFGYPVIFDATHSVQKPGGLFARSGGEREFVFPLARASVAVGVDGIFMEVHFDPLKALCDGPNSVSLDDLPHILETLKRIEAAL